MCPRNLLCLTYKRSDHCDIHHVPFLSNPMTSVGRLLVIVRVIVDVVKDDHVGSGKVDTETPGSCRQQKHKDRVVRVELINQILPAMEQVIYARDSLTTTYIAQR